MLKFWEVVRRNNYCDIFAYFFVWGSFITCENKNNMSCVNEYLFISEKII